MNELMSEAETKPWDTRASRFLGLCHQHSCNYSICCCCFYHGVCCNKRKNRGNNTSFKCNVNIYSCPSVEPPAGCDSGRLALWSSACFQLASLFITATSGLYRLLRWHHRFGLINRLQCHLSSGTSSMLICGGGGVGDALWWATKLQQWRVYLEFIQH